MGEANGKSSTFCYKTGPEKSMKINDRKINRSIDENRLITVD